MNCVCVCVFRGVWGVVACKVVRSAASPLLMNYLAYASNELPSNQSQLSKATKKRGPCARGPGGSFPIQRVICPKCRRKTREAALKK